MGKVIAWSDSEKEFLKEFYLKFGSNYCSKHLGRTIRGIQIKAKELGVKFCGIKEQYHKENLEPLVKDSKSLIEVFGKMNIRAAGGNYIVLKKYIKSHKIDISHFRQQEEQLKGLKKYNFENKIPLEDILVENSTYSRTELKKRLYEDGLKKRECEECGQGETWRGKKISLILDHKNGIHNDNRLLNLRILCPNCNATLDTHAGRNNKNKKLKGPKKPKVYLTKRKVKERPTLEVLKKEIEILGYKGTGRKYGVSDNSIRKWIKNADMTRNGIGASS